MAHNRPDNCLLLRDGSSYFLLGYQSNSALILRDVQGVGGAGISCGQFSRGRWHKLKEEWELEAERERRAETRAERKRLAQIEAAKAAAQEAKRKRRLAEDISWASRGGMQIGANAQATQQGAQLVASLMRVHSLRDAAARQAAAQHHAHQRMLLEAAAQQAAEHKRRRDEEDEAMNKWLNGEPHDEAALERWLARE